MLAGRGCNLFSNQPRFIEQLSATFRVITPDSPQDFGRSVSVGRPTGISDYTAWLGSLFDAFGLSDGINMLGISRGAWMTAEYQLVAPERIGRVVWLEPGSILLPYSPKLWASGFYGLPMMISPSTATAKIGLRPMMPELSKADGHLGELFERFAEELAMGIGCFDLKALDFWRLERQLTDAELASIDAPTLYLAGERERLYSVPKATERLRKAAPQIAIVVVPNVGHDLITVHPEMLAEKVSGWMRG
jgi:pimeloyl-ACP methyl ester carboxylesterase